jgi:Domain of unknown function (DUF397)
MNAMGRGQADSEGANDPGRESRKSSRSYGAGECVLVGGPYGVQIGVRDTKNPQGTVLRFSPAAWRTFVTDVRIGKF